MHHNSVFKIKFLIVAVYETLVMNFHHRLKFGYSFAAVRTKRVN